MKQKLHVLLLALVYALAGCSQPAQTGKDGSVAAIVNGVEITKRQVEYQYERTATPGMTPQQSANLKRSILTNLIGVELLAEKAKSMKLDQSTDYAMERYACEKRALATLAEEKIVGKNSAVSEEQVNTVVQNNPDMFANRTLYTYDAVLIADVEKPFVESLDAMVEKGARLEQLVDQLTAKNVKFVKRRETTPSEKIAAPMLKVLKGLKPNVPAVIIFDKTNRAMLLVLLKTESIPLEGVAAQKAASTLISTFRRRALISKEMKDLVDKANITYFDEYLNTAEADSALAKLPAPDTKRAKQQLLKKGGLGAVFFLSLMFAVMVLTVGMRILYDKLWLPKLWKSKQEAANPEEGTGSYAVRYVPPVVRRLYVFSLFLLIIGTILLDLLLLNSVLPIWALFAFMLAGIVSGVFVSQIFKMERCVAWRRKTYMFIAALLTSPIIIGIFLIMHFRGI